MSKTISTVGRPGRLPIDHLVWVQPGTTLTPTGPGKARVTTARQPATVVGIAGRSATVTVNGRWYTTSVYGLQPRRG